MGPVASAPEIGPAQAARTAKTPTAVASLPPSEVNFIPAGAPGLMPGQGMGPGGAVPNAASTAGGAGSRGLAPPPTSSAFPLAGGAAVAAVALAVLLA
jgi:hypothetical protein